MCVRARECVCLYVCVYIYIYIYICRLLDDQVKLSVDALFKTYRGSKCVNPLILTSAMFGGEWPVSRPGRLTPWQKKNLLNIE